MNVITRPPMSVEDFLAWEQEHRNEFDDGIVIPMNGESRQHDRLPHRLNMALAARIDLGRYEILTSGVQVRVGNTIQYPDLMVTPLPRCRGIQHRDRSGVHAGGDLAVGRPAGHRGEGVAVPRLSLPAILDAGLAYT